MLFDDNHINEYRQTTVPPQWEEEIIEDALTVPKRSRRPIALFGSIAAVFLMLIVGAVVINAFLQTDSLSVVTVSDVYASPVALARADAPHCVRFTLTADGKIALSSDCDTLFVIDEQTDTRSPLSDSTYQRAVVLEWEIADTPAVFTANGCRYQLSVDAANGNVNLLEIVPD